MATSLSQKDIPLYIHMKKIAPTKDFKIDSYNSIGPIQSSYLCGWSSRIGYETNSTFYKDTCELQYNSISTNELMGGGILYLRKLDRQ